MIYVGLRLNKCVVTGYRPHNFGGDLRLFKLYNGIHLFIYIEISRANSVRLLLLIASGGYNF